MCFNCGKLRHIVLGCNNNFDSDAITYSKSIMQKSFTHSDNRNNGGKVNGNILQNDTRRQNYHDHHLGNGSRYDHGIGNGNDGWKLT